MQKLWSATNVSVVGPGNAQDSFARAVSERIGDYDVRTRSLTRSVKGGRSTSTSVQRRRLFEPAEVMSLPAGRAIGFSTGIPATLLRLDHYSTKPYADLVEQSKDYYENLPAKRGASTSPPSQVEGPVTFPADADAMPANLMSSGDLLGRGARP